MNVDATTSYFSRTFWFIWIGFTTSLLAFIFMGFVGTVTTGEGLLSAPPSHGFMITMNVFIALASFLLIRKMKNIKEAAILVVWYTIALALHETPAAIAFVTGFLAKDFDFIWPYVAVAFVINIQLLPPIILKKIKER